MEIHELGKWYTAVVGNERRGDQCGSCGQPIREGQRFYCWQLKFHRIAEGERRVEGRPWVFLHRDCLLNAAEDEDGITDAKFEMYRQQVKEHHLK